MEGKVDFGELLMESHLNVTSHKKYFGKFFRVALWDEL
jgi:hypothetical protein